MKRYLPVTFIILTVLCFRIFAFSFEPISTNYTPSGPRSNQIFRITNTESDRIAVKIEITTRETDLDGTEINNPVEGLFMVYPSRVLLEPGQSKSVRVKWNGDSDPDMELAFRIIAEQIPVEFQRSERSDGGGIRLTYRYMGNIYILPYNAEPEVTVTSFELKEESLNLLVENRGTRHTLMEGLSVSFISSEGEIIHTLSGEDVESMTGYNILAGFSRRFTLPMDNEILQLLDSPGWEVDLEFDPLY